LQLEFTAVAGGVALVLDVEDPDGVVAVWDDVTVVAGGVALVLDVEDPEGIVAVWDDVTVVLEI
jgi:hypothetical protein